MAITFVADSEQAISNASAITVSAPAGIADGDLLVLAIHHGNNWNGQLPFGWTYLGMVQNNINFHSIYLFWRIALASDTTWTFTWTGAYSGSAWCGAYRGGVWVQGSAGGTAPDATTTVKAILGPKMPGVRLDFLATRRDDSLSTVHAAPAWSGATRRAYMDGTNGSRHEEMSVVERTIASPVYTDDVWTLTNIASYVHVVYAVGLVDATPSSAPITGEVIAANGTTAGWVYKGRTLSTDDAPEVP